MFENRLGLPKVVLSLRAGALLSFVAVSVSLQADTVAHYRFEAVDGLDVLDRISGDVHGVIVETDAFTDDTPGPVRKSDGGMLDNKFAADFTRGAFAVMGGESFILHRNEGDATLEWFLKVPEDWDQGAIFWSNEDDRDFNRFHIFWDASFSTEDPEAERWGLVDGDWRYEDGTATEFGAEDHNSQLEISSGEWHHFAIVREDLGDGLFRWRWFVDGKENEFQRRVTQTPLPTARRWLICGRQLEHSLGALIDEIRFSDAALEPEEFLNASDEAQTDSLFRRGDIDADGFVGFEDSIFLACHFFRGTPLPCEDAADVDDSGVLDTTDLVWFFAQLFQGANVPAPGSESCGREPGDPDDFLTCAQYDACAEAIPPPASTDFQLSFDLPAVVEGVPGSTLGFSATVLLRSLKPVDSFGLSVQSNCTMSGIEIVGTVAAASPDGFAEDDKILLVELDDEGRHLEVAVAFSPVNPDVLLPPGSEWKLLTIDFNAQVPAGGCETCVIEFRDGRIDSPVRNQIVGPAQIVGPEFPKRIFVDVGGVGENGFFVRTQGAARVRNGVNLCGERVRPQTFRGAVRICCEEERIDYGVPVEMVLDRRGSFACLRLPPPRDDELGKPVRVWIEDVEENHFNTVYARWGERAGPMSFDGAGDTRFLSSQEFLLPAARDSELSVFLQGHDLTEKNSVRLLVEIAPLALDAISPSRAGNTPVETRIEGGGFAVDTSFSLVPSDPDLGEAIRAARTRVITSELATVDFDLTGAPPGSYELSAENDEGGVVLEDAFDVVEQTVGPRLELALRAPGRYRRDRVRLMTLIASNRGLEDRTAPLVKVTGPLETSFSFDGESFRDGEIQVLAAENDGVLRAGGSVAIPIFFRTRAEGDVRFHAFRLNPLRRDGVEWERREAPAGVNRNDWALVRRELGRMLGASWREYEESLGLLATRLGYRRFPIHDPAKLFAFATKEAFGRPSGAIVGKVVDHSWNLVTGRPVMALLRGEVVSSSVTGVDGHFALGCLEYGVSYQLAVKDQQVLGDAEVTLRGEDVLGIVLQVTSLADSLKPQSPACEDNGLPEESLQVPENLWTQAAVAYVTVVSARDPNSKDGPVGEEEDGLLSPVEELEYTVFFENEEPCDPAVEACDPTIPVGRQPVAALQVDITDVLDEHLNLQNFRFREVQFGDQVIRLDESFLGLSACQAISASSEAYSVTVEEPITNDPGGCLVRVRATLLGGVASWSFETLDPVTCLEPENPDAGFLPVGGQGHVSYTVNADTNPAEDTEVSNEATIVFDKIFDEAAVTNRVTNRISYGLAPATFANLSPCNTSDPSDGCLLVPFEQCLSGDPGCVECEDETCLDWEDAGRADRYEVHLWVPGEAQTQYELPEPGDPELRSSFRPKERLRPATTYNWQIVAVNDANGKRTEGEVWSFRTESAFVRGDANADGMIDLADSIFVLSFLFQGNDRPSCLDAADSDDTGDLNLTDGVYLLNWLFQGEAAPMPPTPSGGLYRTDDCATDEQRADRLSCEQFPPCAVGR